MLRTSPARGSRCRSGPCRSSCGSTIRPSREKRAAAQKAGLMFRFLILLLGMVTTRAGRLDTSPVRRADEDEDEWEDPGRWLDGPRYASDDTWVVARDAQPPARLTRDAEPPRLRPRDQMPPRRRRRLVPRWVKWAAVLALAGLVFRKVVAFTVLAVLSGAFHLVGLNVHLRSEEHTSELQSQSNL